jgi:5-methylcytosine-specific restriction endonuclease McrA
MTRIRQVSARRDKELLDRRVVYAQVVLRDKGQCVLCSNQAVDVHEVCPRSMFGAKTKGKCYTLRNMAAICRDCHGKVVSREGRHKLLVVLHDRFGYSYDDEPWRSYYYGGQDAAQVP